MNIETKLDTRPISFKEEIISAKEISYVPTTRRRVLCVFPVYSKSFGTLHHAYPMMSRVRAFMPPQGILVVAAYLPKVWDIRFVDENIAPVTEAQLQWAEVVIVSGMHIQRPDINRINDLAQAAGNILSLIHI